MKNKLLLTFLLTIILIMTFHFSHGQLLAKSNFTGIIVPQYMITGGMSTTRLPVMFRATVTSLIPKTTYRYYTMMARYSDIGFTPGTSGSGYSVYTGTASYTYTTTPGLSTAGTYSTFTTDSQGNYTGWFGIVNSNNTRFTAGNYLYPTITLNDGAGGNTVSARYAMDDSIKVMTFSAASGPNNATGIWGNSSATARNMIALYNNITGTGKPLAITYAESEAITVNGVPTYYSTNVDNKAGAWGTLIPNVNANGVRRVEQLSLSDGSLVGCATDDDGLWPGGPANTINPAGGTTAVVISSTDAPLNDCVPAVTISTTTINPSNVKQGTNHIILYNINLYANVIGTSLDTLKITSAGSYVATDIKTYGFNLWYSNDPVLDTLTDMIVDSLPAAGPGLLSFKVPVTLTVHKTAYLFVTAKISTFAAIGDSIYITSTPFSGLVLHNGSKTGVNPVPAAGAKTIVSVNSPMLNVTSLLPFGKHIINTTTAEQQFVLSGTNLVPASNFINITPPSGFQVSLTSGSGFSSSAIQVAYSAKTLAATNIYVIFKPALIISYSGNITITGGSTNEAVAVSGTGARDSIPVKVNTAYAFSLNKVKVVFSEAVDSTGEIIGNFTGLGTILSAVRSAKRDTVTLTLGTFLSPGISKNLTINNVEDTVKNKMTSPQFFLIIFGELPTDFIYQVSQNNSKGIPDSLNVRCKLRGTVQSINYSQTGLQFFIHDGTGGIRVYRNNQVTPPYNVRMGDTVKVIGMITQQQGMTQITIDSIRLIDTTHALRVPYIVKKLNESTESEVVTLKYLFLINYAQWPTIAGATRTVQASNGKDTFSIVINRNSDLQGTSPPPVLFDMTGIGAQSDIDTPYFSGYQLWPRTTADLYMYTFPPKHLVINEILAVSKKTDGWVEIFNPNTSDIPLYSYYFTDNASNPVKFKLPDTTLIPAQGYLLVYDSVHPANPGIHLNFSFKKTGGIVMLKDYMTNTHDSVGYGVQKSDTSFARIPNGTGNFIFAMPTPLSLNRIWSKNIPSYQIGQINIINSSTGIADSINLRCKLTGVVTSINYLAYKPGYTFTLHDATAGIGLFKDPGTFTNYATVNMGDWIRVIGIIDQQNGMLMIQPDSIVKLESNHTINSPLVVTSLNETTESELVRINNLTMTDTINYPWPKATDNAKDVFGTDGTTTFKIHIETECGLHGKHGYTAPKKIFDIIGIGWQYDDIQPYTSGYMIYPRLASDIILHTGIADNGNHDIRVFPNPNNGRFTVERPVYGPVTIEIFNSVGSSVYRSPLQYSSETIDLAVPPGIYFIRILNIPGSVIYNSKITVR